MSLASRLNRLETSASLRRGAESCGFCRGPINWRAWKPAPGDVKYRVLANGEEPGVPDLCPQCGRQLVLRLEHDRSG